MEREKNMAEDTVRNCLPRKDGFDQFVPRGCRRCSNNGSNMRTTAYTILLLNMQWWLTFDISKWELMTERRATSCIYSYISDIYIYIYYRCTRSCSSTCGIYIVLFHNMRRTREQSQVNSMVIAHPTAVIINESTVQIRISKNG